MNISECTRWHCEQKNRGALHPHVEVPNLDDNRTLLLRRDYRVRQVAAALSFASLLAATEPEASFRLKQR